MRLGTILIITCMALGVAVLGGLGTWQVKRMIWKESLIESVEDRIKLLPVNLLELLDSGTAKSEMEYTPVTITGNFDHSKEVYFYSTNKKGAVGWNVHTPMILDNGKVLVVNRGFVPYDLKNPAQREEGQVTSNQLVTGLVRIPLKEKPNSFVPDNALEKREFYWRDLEEMANLMRNEENQEFLGVIVDTDATGNPGGWPHGGTTIVSFPNNHLQYAITWYGLALALLGVGGFFLYSRRQGNNE